MFKLVLEKAEGPDIRLLTSAVTSKKKKKREREFLGNIYFCFIDYVKDFGCVDHKKKKKKWKILK